MTARWTRSPTNRTPGTTRRPVRPAASAPRHRCPSVGVHSDDDDDYEPEEQGIVKLEQALGRTMDINNRYYGDFDEFSTEGTMSWMETWDIENGRIPLVGWGCTYSEKIINGSLDDIIRKTAQVMKAFGHEFFMRYCWEMDGSRKQWEVKGPEKFVAAWRRMWTIFAEEGATNVIWVWTPNAAGFKDKRSYTDDQPPTSTGSPPTATTGASPSGTRATAGVMSSRSSMSSWSSPASTPSRS
jgi:Beta-mannanase